MGHATETAHFSPLDVRLLTIPLYFSLFKNTHFAGLFLSLFYDYSNNTKFFFIHHNAICRVLFFSIVITRTVIWVSSNYLAFNFTVRHLVQNFEFFCFSSELSGCDSSNQEVMSEGDPEVPRWPYRFEALVKQSSPLSASIRNCNLMVFPLQTG